MAKRFDRGDLNPHLGPKTGYSVNPSRYSSIHYQSQLINKFVGSSNIFESTDRLKGIVLKVLKEPSIIDRREQGKN